MLSLYLALISEPSDKEKFDKLYNSYRDKMYATAMSVLHNPSLAEEAVSESFFKIAKKFALFSEISGRKTQSLIVIIVRNTAIDILRKERPEKSESLGDIAEYSDSVAFPDVRAVLEGGTSELLEAIDSLDSIYSDALKLKYIFGYGSADIGGLLGISEKGAATRIYRAKIMLKEKLEKMGYEID